jgi:hypothetical protein
VRSETVAAVRAELCGHLREYPPPTEVAAPTGTTSLVGSEETVFVTGNLRTVFTSRELDALDVRAKDELAQRRRDRARNRYLWWAFGACAAGLVLAGLLELGLKGGRIWQRNRLATVAANTPAVKQIETKNTLALRIEELSTRRLLPLEMITLAGAKLAGSNIQFVRTSTKGLYTLEIEAKTRGANDAANYQAALRDLPTVAAVKELPGSGDRAGITTFTIQITFKPDALRPASAPAPAPVVPETPAAAPAPRPSP